MVGKFRSEWIPGNEETVRRLMARMNPDGGPSGFIPLSLVAGAIRRARYPAFAQKFGTQKAAWPGPAVALPPGTFASASPGPATAPAPGTKAPAPPLSA